MGEGRNLALISFTPINAPGGVPRWNRDFKKCFPEAKHFSWWDCPLSKLPDESSEWDKARALNSWLRRAGAIKHDDIVIVDGFWGMGLEDFPNVVSVCHGIWSHLTKEDADAGVKPDFPIHHAVQVGYRKGHLNRGGRLVSVSMFIQHQMDIQWGFESEVINNAIDLDDFKPTFKPHCDWMSIIHGVNDKKNPVKGWDHIEHAKRNSDGAEILSLDEAYKKYGSREDVTKYDVLSWADFVLIPSAFEGNSYFALESLALDVPVVAYDVGLFYEISEKGLHDDVGVILPIGTRHVDNTVIGIEEMMKALHETRPLRPRDVASRYSLQKFHAQWRAYLKKEFDYGT